MSEEKVWEKQALEHLLLENLKEQRRGRRWRTAVRMMTLLVFVGVAINLFDIDLGGKSNLGKHTALVDLQGEIALRDRIFLFEFDHAGYASQDCGFLRVRGPSISTPLRRDDRL